MFVRAPKTPTEPNLTNFLTVGNPYNEINGSRLQDLLISHYV